MIRKTFAQLRNTVCSLVSTRVKNLPKSNHKSNLRLEPLEDRRLMTTVPHYIDTDYTVQQINEGGEPLYNKPAIYGTSLYYLDSDTTIGAELRRLNTSTGMVSVVADINPGIGDSLAGRTGLVVANNKLYFTAIDPTHGMELRWMDLTQANPSIEVLDLAPGEQSSSPGALGGLAAIGNKLYFLAGNVSAPQLYWIDTTAASPTPNVVNISLSDMKDVATAANVMSFTAVGNKLYFAAPDIASGYELRYIDTATAPSTVQTIEQIAGAGSVWQWNTFRGLFSAADKLYFRIESETGATLNWLDTSLETPVVHSYSNAASYNTYRIQDGDKLYFITANESTSGGFVHWLDASQDNPTLNQIRFTSNERLGGAGATGLAVIGSKLYFVAKPESEQSSSLFWIDLTSTSTQANRIQLTNASGNAINEPDGTPRRDYHFQVVGNKLYFTAYDQAVGMELRWINTSENTPVIHTIDINTVNGSNKPAGSDAGRFGGFVTVGSRMFFTARTYDQPSSAQSNSLLEGEGGIIAQFDMAMRYLLGDTDLYWIDTTQDNPTPNRIELFAGKESSISSGFGNNGLEAHGIVGTKLFFNAEDSHLGVRTRWIDTSIPNGPIHTLNNVPYGDPTDVMPNIGRQGNFGVVGTKVFFGGIDHRLRWVDTSESGMPLHEMSEDISLPGEIGGYVVAGTRLYFFASVNSVWELAWIDTALDSPTLHTIDGFGTTPIYNTTHRFLQVIGGRLFFNGANAAGEGLKWIDLNSQSPVVSSIDGPAQLTKPTLVGNRLYMVNLAEDNKLYWVDTSASSLQLSSITVAKIGSYRAFNAVGNKLYFDAFDATTQTQALYWIDSTAATPTIHRVPGNYEFGSYWSKLVIVGDRLFFDAIDAGSTNSLRSIRWIDTTSDNPVVQILDTGMPLTSGAVVYASFQNRIYFIAGDAIFGNELRWVDMSDPEKAVNIVDLNSGPDNSFTISQAFVVTNNKMYLTAEKVGLGGELIALNVTDENGAITAVGESYDVPVNYIRRTDDSLGALTTLGQDNGVLANDTGLGSNATTTLITPPAHGTLTFNTDGTFRYRPAANAVVGQSETFTYRVTDSSGRTSDATVELKITASIPSPFHNQATPTDVSPGTTPGVTTAMDALAIINLMNSKQLNAVPVEDISTVLGYHYDVNNDFIVSALDLLAVFNFLNAQSLSQQGEGEPIYFFCGNSIEYSPDNNPPVEPSEPYQIDLSDLYYRKKTI